MSMHPLQIRVGQTYVARASHGKWHHRVDQIVGGQVTYTVVAGDKDLIGHSGETTLEDFVARLSDFKRSPLTRTRKG